MSIRGSVDRVTTKGAAGWAYAEGKRNDILVQAVLSHEVIGDAIAGEHRPDLAAVGMGNGNCGFTIAFYREIEPLYLPFVSIKVDGGDIELPRLADLGFGEFFAAFHRNHPAAGRSRSVLGGLWTDRTDAAAILKAKHEINQIDTDTAALLSQLIHQGVAILPLPDASVASKKSSPLDPDRVAALIEGPPMLAALRAIFDDNPLVLSAATCKEGSALVQPSAEIGLPSAAECLVIACAAGDTEITVEIVRDSHRFPEFTAGGVSRWASAQVHAGLEVAAAQQGLMSRLVVPASAAAIVGPGTIYRVRCANGAGALKLSCAPSRAMPMTLASTDRREIVRKSGVRVLTE